MVALPSQRETGLAQGIRCLCGQRDQLVEAKLLKTALHLLPHSGWLFKKRGHSIAVHLQTKPTSLVERSFIAGRNRNGVARIPRLNVSAEEPARLGPLFVLFL